MKKTAVLVVVCLIHTAAFGNIYLKLASSAGAARDQAGALLPANSTILIFSSLDTTINLDTNAPLRSSYGPDYGRDTYLGSVPNTLAGRLTTSYMTFGAAGNGNGSYVGTYIYAIPVNLPYSTYTAGGATPESIGTGTYYGVQGLISGPTTQYDTVPPTSPQTFDTGAIQTTVRNRDVTGNDDRVLGGYALDYPVEVVILSVTPRPRSNLIDIDYLYSNSTPRLAEVRGFAYPAAVRLAALKYSSGIYPINTLVEGTAANYGADIAPSGTPRRLTWDAGADIGYSVQDIRVRLCACETNALPLSQHFVTIPANGTNSALTISRYASIADQPALDRALLFAVCRGWATVSESNLIAVGGPYDAQVIFTNGGMPTATGRLWMCEKLGSGIRLATPAEVKRAQEATTPGTVIQRPSYAWPDMKVNAYGIETGVSNAWYFVKE